MSTRKVEYQSCVALAEWWGFYSRVSGLPPCALLHIANQSSGGARNGFHLKRMGVRAGVSDYFLAVPRRPFSGLWLEMKRPDGKVSAEQKQFMVDMRALGYDCQVARSTDEARQIIETYLART